MQSHKDNPCKSFAPNFFNKNKCQNCFRPRETHLQSDKDLNKAKPIFGGWLLLAPIGTDFNNPTQKNRKWQRRWFVLFEHGALRYALDNSETTVAQGTIDMNRCADVEYAEPITNQKHSICISLPEKSYYIRGECKEDSMGWYDQLVVYPQTMKEEKRLKKRLFKRKSDASSHGQQELAAITTSHSAPSTPVAKPKNSYNIASHLAQIDDLSKQGSAGSLLRSSNSSSSSSVKSAISEKGELVSSFVVQKSNDLDGRGKEQSRSSGTHINRAPESSSGVSADVSHKKLTEAGPRVDGIAPPTGSLRRNISTSTGSLSDSSASNQSLAESTDGSQTGVSKKKHLMDYQNFVALPRPTKSSSSHTKPPKKEIEKPSRHRSPPRDDSGRTQGREARRSRLMDTFEVVQSDPSNKENSEPGGILSDGSHGDQIGSTAPRAASPEASPLDLDWDNKRGRGIDRKSNSVRQGTHTDQMRSSAALRRAKSLDRKDLSLLTADSFSVKEGWLQMKNKDGKWKKFWFVLVKKELKYFQDSASDASTPPEGVIDLANFLRVKEWDIHRNYGFQIETAEAPHVFAAMTATMRKKWIKALEMTSPGNDVTAEEASLPNPPEPNPEKVIQVSPTTVEVEDTGKAQRSKVSRRARVSDRRKGRFRTYDFAELRPLAAQAIGVDPVQDEKANPAPKLEPKARSRILEPVSLLKDVKTPPSKQRNDVVDGGRKVDPVKNLATKPPVSSNIHRSSSNIRVSIENEWKKVENLNYPSMKEDVVVPHHKSITETASMVKALRNEVDSLKKQMERVETERSSSQEEDLKVDSYSESDLTTLDGRSGTKSSIKEGDQSHVINQLKQELSEVEDALRKQSGELRECNMKLDISVSEAQLVETQVTNLQSELRLEKARRDEIEKEHVRKVSALTKDLEASESQLEKTETLHLDAQRKIRELERQIHMQKDHGKEEKLLQDHIGMLRGRAEKQESEMREMQEAFEERCQNQKVLEDRLSETDQLIKSYEEQMHEMKAAMKGTDKDITIITAHRNDAQASVKKLQSSLDNSHSNERKLKEQIEELIVQSQAHDEHNRTLEEDLTKEKDNSHRLRKMLEEHDNDFTANEKQLEETNLAIEQLNGRLKSVENEKTTLHKKLKDLKSDNKKLKDEVAKTSQSEQTIKDLRLRLKAAEKQLGDIEDIRSRSSSSSESSFKTKLTELEAEMGGTGQMIAARIQSLEPSRRVSDPHISVERETLAQKIHRLELEIEKKAEDLNESENRLKRSEDMLREAEEREIQTDERLTTKLKKLERKQEVTSKEFENIIDELKLSHKELDERFQATKDCLHELHSRAAKINNANSTNNTTKMLETVLQDILQLSSGMTKLSTWPQQPSSPNAEIANENPVSRLRQLTERLKSADGRLVSPTESPSIFPRHPMSSGQLTENVAAQLFAKQISTQALLLAEMAVTLRHSQSQPEVTASGRNQPNFNHNNRQSATSPQPTAAEFTDTLPHHQVADGLLQHVDTLAQKLTLEGLLMREMSKLKETWRLNRGRNPSHRSKALGSSSNSELSSAVVAHAHINYVLQVYNERISRLSLEARQARHRADAAMRKLRELVTACKTEDLAVVSSLAVQIDTDSIAPPYSNVPTWEQQVDYGTLHGAQSMTPPSSSTEAAYLDQEATFFQRLSEDLKCMSVDVQSLSKLGAQLLQTDTALHKCLQPSEVGEHASTVAREAIVQAEIIYVSHRLRRDYDEELRKAKNAVFEQSSHFEALENKLKQTEEDWTRKLKKVNEKNASKVSKLKRDVEELEAVRSGMSEDVNNKLAQLAKRHQEEISSCNLKHEENCATLQKDLSTAKSQLQVKSKEYMNEIKSLTQRLEQIQIQHRKESDSAREDYNRKFKMAKAECAREIATTKKEHDVEMGDLKEDFEKEISEVEKEFADKLTAIETAKKMEMETLTKKHQTSVKIMEEDHKEALAEAEQNVTVRVEALKRDFDDLLKQEKSKHEMALVDAREDAESAMRDVLQESTNELKKEHEKVLENRDKLHKEQLEREKEAWMKEMKLQLEAQHVVSHSRSSSSTSEGDSKDGLKARISSLEEQLNSVQGRLEDEQHRHNYQVQLDEIKALCDESFNAIEQSHTKQLEDMAISHQRELERLQEEHDDELEANKQDTKKVIEAMRKHHIDEMSSQQEQLVQTGLSPKDNLEGEIDKLNSKIETLSDHYSRKCVELADLLEQNERQEDSIKSLERDNRRLRARKAAISDQKLESEILKMKNSPNDERFAGDLYQLQVMLRVKSSEIDYLKQEVTSLNKQLDDAEQEIKHSTRKHKNLFEDLTLSRSKEGMARREIIRVKEQLHRHGIQSDDDLDVEGVNEEEVTADNPKGYDFQKSRSQPAFKPTSSLKSSTVTSVSASVKRRSSDRSSRHGKV